MLFKMKCFELNFILFNIIFNICNFILKVVICWEREREREIDRDR